MTGQRYAFDATKTRVGYGAIDIVVNMYTPEVIAQKRVPTASVSTVSTASPRLGQLNHNS